MYNLGHKMKAATTFFLAWLTLMPAIAKQSNKLTESESKFLSDVLAAVQRKDPGWIAAHSVLPMVILPESEARLVTTEAEFAKVVSVLLTDRLRASFESEAKREPIADQGGVRIGYGILWFEERHTADGSLSHCAITSFGFFAFQPKPQTKTPGPTPLKGG